MAVIRGNFEIYFGENSFTQLLNRLDTLKYSSAAILIDSNLSSNIRVVELIQLFQNAFTKVDIRFITLRGEPTYSDLDREFKAIENLSLESIIAIGGGSLVDLAKGLSILFTNPGAGVDYRGIHKVKTPGLPLIVFPSTAGTGTEMTWTASFVDTKSETKLGINGDNIFPKFAVLDPGLLLGAPKPVLLSAALDTLVHAIEAITSTMANPFTIALGKTAVGRVVDNLEIALGALPDIEALAMLQLAAAEAGLAMLNSSGGPASGISYPLGVHYKVPHGFAGGILLPAVMKENIRLGYRGYSIFDSDELNGELFLTKLQSLYLRLNVPKDFRHWGFDSLNDMHQIIELTISQRLENLKLNPVIFNQESLTKTLEGFVI